MGARQSAKVLVIGAGFGGLGTAIALRRAGFPDVMVLERAAGVGGVWRENTYPGAACDVPSPLYSWSFRPNPQWGRRYSPQPEILRYIEEVASEEDVLGCVETGVEVTSATYDEAAGAWTVTAADGRTWNADIVVSARGQLCEPVLPSVPGRDSFAGPAFHSAQWRHDVPLARKRVAVIGTGASAIQFVPEVADTAAEVTVFQRSAPYVLPKPDQEYTPSHHQRFVRWPALLRLERRSTFRFTEVLNHVLEADSVGARALGAFFRARLRLAVRDPELRARVTPDYPIGCKRILFSNDWYAALSRPHVDVVTEPVSRIEPEGVRTADGVLHRADVLVHGTGFAASDFLRGLSVTGRDGQRLEDLWDEGAWAHLGLTVPGFPNLFFVYGPNTNLGGSSIIAMLEAQASYVVQAARLVASGRRVEVRPEVAASYDAEMQRRLGRSVWSRCSNWYQTSSGRIPTNWPGLVQEYLDRTAQLDPADLA